MITRKIILYFILLLNLIWNTTYAQSINTKVFSSVENILNARSLKPGEFLKVLGYYKNNDGGAAEYYVKKNDVADSSEHVIQLSNGLCAVLVAPQFVNYKMFGAKGDGINNDAVQIAAAHEYANKKNLPVINSLGEFWLKTVKKIVIQTNVNWGKTIFHIDESFNTSSSTRFEIVSNYRPENIVLSTQQKSELLSSIKPGVSEIPLLKKYKNHLVFIADANDKIGFRSGESFKGQSWAREEFFYVEEYGRIIGDIAWQFKDYTKLVAYRADENYLRVSGGTFYLSGNSPTTNSRGYLQNGIAIRRSRTIISDQWVGLEPGAADTSTLNPRSGFYNFSSVYDVQLENIRLIPYEQNRGSEARNVSSGTYGISMARVLNCSFKNVTAEGSLIHWGVFGSNLIKNFNVENCKLNRVDVHFHCWNLKIANSEIGFRGITVTGGGNLIVENSSCAGRSFIGFRSDFGSKWDGDIRIINSTFKVSAEDKTVAALAFLPRNFDYRYPVGFGRSIIIENFNIDFTSIKNKEATCWLVRVPSFSKMKTGERLFIPEYIKFENIRVIGREKGTRLFELSDMGSYQLKNSGEYNSARLTANARFIFNDVDLEKLSNEHLAATHLAISGTNEYVDKYALYPSIKFSGCKNIVVKTSGIADFSFDDCDIAGFNTNVENIHRGRMVFTRCNFNPVLKDSIKNIYNVASESGTNFTDCVVHAPELKNLKKPDMLDKVNFIQVNRKVRFNHSNTLLGRDLLDYYKSKKIAFQPKFISMLKSHHELENENVQ